MDFVYEISFGGRANLEDIKGVSLDVEVSND